MKNKKILKLLLIVTLIFSSFLLIHNSISKVKADSGFDSSYDSSSSSDWGSSSSSWGSSSDYNSGSSGSGDISGLITFVVVIAIIVYIAIKNKDNSVTSLLFKLDHQHEVSFEKLSELIPGFNKEQFIKDRYDDYLKIQNAWMNFDYDTIRSMVTDELYNQYEMQLDTLKIKNEKNIMSGFEYKDSIITGINSENNKLTVTIELVCSFYDYIEKDGKVIRGTKAQKITQHYEMTFVSSLSNNTIKKCPNCGAKLNDAASQKCEYCGSMISSVSEKWVLSKKESKNQR